MPKEVMIHATTGATSTPKISEVRYKMNLFSVIAFSTPSAISLSTTGIIRITSPIRAAITANPAYKIKKSKAIPFDHFEV